MIVRVLKRLDTRRIPLPLLSTSNAQTFTVNPSTPAHIVIVNRFIFISSFSGRGRQKVLPQRRGLQIPLKCVLHVVWNELSTLHDEMVPVISFPASCPRLPLGLPILLRFLSVADSPFQSFHSVEFVVWAGYTGRRLGCFFRQAAEKLCGRARSQQSARVARQNNICAGRSKRLRRWRWQCGDDSRCCGLGSAS